MQTTAPAKTHFMTLYGNEAVARVAYALNEVIAIYPIPPASPIGEWAGAWDASGKPNLWELLSIQGVGFSIATIPVAAQQAKIP